MGYVQALEGLVELASEKAFAAANKGRDNPNWTEINLNHLKMLRGAEPFYWAPHICELMESVPVADLMHMPLRADLVPVSNGFWWFAHPIDLPKWDSDPTFLRALVWKSFTGGFEIATYHHFWGRQNSPDTMGQMQWKYGQSLHDARLTYHNTLGDEEAARDYWFNDPWGEEALLRFVAMLLFIDQRIFTSTRTEAPRHTRKRMAREHPRVTTDIRVVELRKRFPRTATPTSGAEAVQWACRWLVSGHWRNQWYPSLNEHRPKWIMPYTKGPDGYPIKPPSMRIFNVAR